MSRSKFQQIKTYINMCNKYGFNGKRKSFVFCIKFCLLMVLWCKSLLGIHASYSTAALFLTRKQTCLILKKTDKNCLFLWLWVPNSDVNTTMGNILYFCLTKGKMEVFTTISSRVSVSLSMSSRISNMSDYRLVLVYLLFTKCITSASYFISKFNHLFLYHSVVLSLVIPIST